MFVYSPIPLVVSCADVYVLIRPAPTWTPRTYTWNPWTRWSVLVDQAVQTLPRTLFLIIFFALMLLSHEVPRWWGVCGAYEGAWWKATALAADVGKDMCWVFVVEMLGKYCRLLSMLVVVWASITCT